MEKKKSTWIRTIVLALVCLIIGGLFIALMLSKTSGEEAKEQKEIRNYVEDKSEYVMENDDLKFVLDPSTTWFTVTKKSTGEVWYSNPVDADSDPLAKKKNKLKSTAIIKYSTSQGVETDYDNYDNSIARGFYEIEEGSDYVKVYYSCGNVKKEYTIPVAVPESRMNEFLLKMEKSDQRKVKEYYRKIDLKKLRATDDKAALVAQYPDLETEPVYELRDNTKEHLKEKMEVMFANVGYTPEDYQADLERYEKAESKNDKLFNFSMVYRLTEDGLKVEVPLDDMDYPAKYPLVEIDVLPFFGAGSTEDEGYMFVPEGGGSIINFNNGKNNSAAYLANVYGADTAIPRKFVVHETKVEYPVFGMAKNNSSFICIIEQGESYASINADISGNDNNSYNNVFSSYQTLHYEAYDVSKKSNTPVYVFEKNMPHETLSQEYRFLDSNSYVDMALAYREYLLKKYPNLEKNTDDSTPVAVEIVGAIDKVQRKLGLPVSAPWKVTSYKEAIDIIQQIKDAGVDNLSIKLSGWVNGGVNQKILKKTKLISELGGKKDFKKLMNYVNDNNIPLYLNGFVEYAYDDSKFDGFVAYRDSAKYPSQEKAKIYHYNIVSYEDEDWNDPYFLLKPSVINQNIVNLGKAAKDYNAAGIAFEDYGNISNANYDRRDLHTRSECNTMQTEEVKKIADAGYGVMVNSGNEYSLAVADFITHMDLPGSQYAIIDENVPFYQIALHGYVNYAAEPINLAGDYKQNILESAEAGAALYFTFMEADASKTQTTPYTKYFGAEFDLWKEDMQAIYKDYNDKMGSLFNQTIVGHKNLTEKVAATTYENGSVVYVNYGEDEYTVEGVTIPARSFVVEGGK